MFKKEFLPLAIFALLVLWITGSGLFSLNGDSASEPTATQAVAAVSPTEAPSATPTLTPTPMQTFTPTATQTPTPESTAAPTQTVAAEKPSPTPKPTFTPTPSSTPRPAQAVASPSPTPQLGRVVASTPNDTIIYVKTDVDSQSHSLWCLQRDDDPEDRTFFHEHAAAPSWAPNGQQLAFFGEEGISLLGPPYRTGIWVVDVTEECLPQNPRLLAEVNFVQNIAWSSDGTKLAFEINQEPSTERSNIFVVDAGDGGDVVDPDSEERIPVKIPGRQPAWSPDGQKLAVNTCVDSACGLWQFNFLGEREQQLTFGDTDSYPTWARVGNIDHIVFVRKESASQWDIYTLSPGNGQPTSLTNRNDIDTAPVFSPDGREVYIYTNHEGGGEHWRIEAIDFINGKIDGPVVTGIGESKLHGLARPTVR